MIQKKKIESEDAVSPVIGVMLMLVITVIIAAVVTGFATGVVGTADGPTMIMIEPANIVSGYSLESVDFIHKGGDAVELRDLYFVLQHQRGYNLGISVTYVPPSDENDHSRDGMMFVVGKEDLGYDAVAETGDVIRLNVMGYGIDSYFERGNPVKWTLFETGGNNIIADGEFMIP